MKNLDYGERRFIEDLKRAFEDGGTKITVFKDLTQMNNTSFHLTVEDNEGRLFFALIISESNAEFFVYALNYCFKNEIEFNCREGLNNG